MHDTNRQTVTVTPNVTLETVQLWAEAATQESFDRGVSVRTPLTVHAGHDEARNTAAAALIETMTTTRPCDVTILLLNQEQRGWEPRPVYLTVTVAGVSGGRVITVDGDSVDLDDLYGIATHP